jgi:hypothetical protein
VTAVSTSRAPTSLRRPTGRSAAELRDHLVGSRRRLVGAIWERGVARGELAPDVDQDVAIDLVFGPATYRLVARHAPLDEAAADQIVDTAMRGLGAR